MPNKFSSYLFTISVLSLLLSSAMVAGGIGEWRTYTSKKDIREITLVRGNIWAATGGGMFSFDPARDRSEEFTGSEGLRSNDLTSISSVKDGSLWIGSANGYLHNYLPTRRSWKYVTDIARDLSPQRRINTLLSAGDTLYVGSEIGLSVYLTERKEFRATVRAFGSPTFQNNSVTGVALYADSIWVTTSSGIACAARVAPNLAAPDVWRTWTAFNGKGLAVFGGQLFAATTQGLRRYESGNWFVVSGTAGQSVSKIVAGNDSLYFLMGSQVIALDAGGNLTQVFQQPGVAPVTFSVSDTTIVVGTTAGRLYFRVSAEWRQFATPGPPTNLIVGLAVDKKGQLWAGTASAFGEGFMRFDGNRWTVYRAEQYPQFRGNDFYKVSIGPNNTKWASSWGSGVAVIDNDDDTSVVYNTRNGLARTFCSGCDSRYSVVIAAIPDRQERMWIALRQESGGDTTFSILNNDGTFSYVRFSYPGANLTPIFIDVAIDQNGTKWFANSKSSEAYEVGLYFYNENGFPGGVPNAKWNRLTKNNGLSSDKIFAIAVDLRGEVWAGTDLGISIIMNPYSARPSVASYFPLRDQQVTAILVDPLNNKWVATRAGVFVLSPDGTSIIAHYTTANTDSRLVDNEIISLALDTDRGIMYFGSERGLSSLKTAAVAPKRSFDELSLSPNPFIVPSNQPMMIDGLVEGSTLKILSVEGNLINEIKTPGGRIGFWDGTDQFGKVVSSGVYIVVAYSENGSQIASGKIAVLRK